MHKTMMMKTTYQLLMLFGSLLIIAGCAKKNSTQEITPPIREAVPDHAGNTLNALIAAEPPSASYTDMAMRLTDADTAQPAPKQSVAGDVETFWFLRDAQHHEQVEATLSHQSDNFNLWVGAGANVNANDLDEAATILETKLLSTTLALLNVELSPGIDGDTRINILHLESIGGTGTGTGTAGYFFVGDLAPKSVNRFSNERKMLYIGLDLTDMGKENYYGTIAHEMEHLIHDAVDRNEAAWVDEGMAEVSAARNGHQSEKIKQFSPDPDLQLNHWSGSLAHYGASYLFNEYFIQRFGEDAFRAVFYNGDNGFRGYGSVLSEQGIPDYGVDRFFGDWVVANYLTSIGMGVDPYQYSDQIEIPKMAHETVSVPATGEGSVHQYGVDYLKFSGDNPVTLIFTGSTQVNLVDAAPYSGDYYWTTYPADRSDMTLTREFDLTAVQTATLKVRTWYEIEAGWDYGYIVASVDGGNKWEVLSDPFYSTTADPRGTNLGSAYTGKSVDYRNQSASEDEERAAEWTEITIDLSDYAGQSVLLRFEYVTDQAVFEQGWVIDDIAIPEIGYSETFDQDSGGWNGSGWVRHTNKLPQLYLIQAITLDENGSTVETLTLDKNDQTGSFTLNPNGNDMVITVSGITPVTTQSTSYQYELR